MIKTLILPILISLIRIIKTFLFSKSFYSFEDALSYANTFGYENPILIEFLYEKTIKFRQGLVMKMVLALID